jgi:hypothetical protein
MRLTGVDQLFDPRNMTQSAAKTLLTKTLPARLND